MGCSYVEGVGLLAKKKLAQAENKDFKKKKRGRWRTETADTQGMKKSYDAWLRCEGAWAKKKGPTTKDSNPPPPCVVKISPSF